MGTWVRPRIKFYSFFNVLHNLRPGSWPFLAWISTSIKWEWQHRAVVRIKWDMVDAPLLYQRWNTWTVWYVFQDSFTLQKKIQEFSLLWRFLIDLHSFSCLPLLYCSPATIITGSYIVLASHVYVSASPRRAISSQEYWLRPGS